MNVFATPTMRLKLLAAVFVFCSLDLRAEEPTKSAVVERFLESAEAARVEDSFGPGARNFVRQLTEPEKLEVGRYCLLQADRHLKSFGAAILLGTRARDEALRAIVDDLARGQGGIYGSLMSEALDPGNEVPLPASDLSAKVRAYVEAHLEKYNEAERTRLDKLLRR